MSRSQRVILCILSISLALITVSCQKEEQQKKPGADSTTSPVTETEPQPKQIGVGIEKVGQTYRIKLSDDPALITRGQTVEWYATTKTLKIKIETQGMGAMPMCPVDADDTRCNLDTSQAERKVYKYSVIITTPEGLVVSADPDLDIRW